MLRSFEHCLHRYYYCRSTKLGQWGNTLAANGTIGTNSSHSLVIETSGLERGRITNEGNWAIGSTGTTSKFTVNSATNVSPFRAQINGSTKFIVNGNGSSYGIYGISRNYGGYFVGKVHATGGYTSGSDRKLKQNITELSSAIDIINKLQPKTYEYRQDGDYQLMNLPKGRHFGLIAQDLEEVLPNLVHEAQFNTAIARPKEVNFKATQANTGTPSVSSEMEASKGEVIDYKTVNYMELIPILVKGIPASLCGLCYFLILV